MKRALLALLLLAGELQAQEEFTAEVFLVKGQAEWQRPGEEAWQPLSVGQKIEEGSRIRTGKRSQVGLNLPGQMEMRIKSESLFMLRPVEPGEEKLSVALVIGKLLARVAGSGGKPAFSVETATAVAGVRGTVFSVAVAEDSTSLVAVDEGQVELMGEESLLLNPGQQAQQEEGGRPELLPAPVKISQWLKERRQKALERREQLLENLRKKAEETLEILRRGQENSRRLVARMEKLEKNLQRARRMGDERTVAETAEKFPALVQELKEERGRMWKAVLVLETRAALAKRLSEIGDNQELAKRLEEVNRNFKKLHQAINLSNRQLLHRMRQLIRLERAIWKNLGGPKVPPPEPKR